MDQARPKPPRPTGERMSNSASNLLRSPLAATLLGLACLASAPGCQQARADQSKTARLDPPLPAPAAAAPHPVTIHRPYPALGMNTGLRDHRGMPARAPCGTCHGFVSPKDKYRHADKLDEFHKGVEVDHGGQSCRTCHAVPGFESFNLADGQTVGYHEVIRLCGQCHAQRLEEYEHGAHGGMTGHWDLTRGPRSRNHCIDCHNPHAPAIPRMEPAPAPRHRSFD